MVIIELTYKKSLETVNRYLEEHRAFLQELYDRSLLLVSGPKKPRSGGIMIALVDKDVAELLMHDDPFFQNDIADYHFIEFSPNRTCQEMNLFRK